jgi:hypothetical protein
MEVTNSGFNPVQFIRQNVKSGNLTEQEVFTLKDARKAIQDKAAEYRADGTVSAEEAKGLRQLRQDFRQQAQDLAGNEEYRVDIQV